MTKKIVYVLPDDLVEVRVCDPVFEEGANAGAWHQSLNPRSVLFHVANSTEISVLTPFADVYRGIAPHRKQLL